MRALQVLKLYSEWFVFLFIWPFTEEREKHSVVTYIQTVAKLLVMREFK